MDTDDLKITYDPKIMGKLLEEPEVKKFVAKMTPQELDWYKELLVSQGIYGRYCQERENGI